MKRTSLIVVVLVLTASIAWAQTPFTPFIDDFEDGNARDGNPVRWNTGSVTDGSYVLSGTGLHFAFVNDFIAADISIRTQVRVLASDGGSSSMGVWADSWAGQGSYWGVIDTEGNLSVGVKNSMLGEIETDLDPRSSDIVLQFDVVGRTLSITAWREGDPKPSSPQLTEQSNITMPAGYIGVSIDKPPFARVAFRSFEALKTEDRIR